MPAVVHNRMTKDRNGLYNKLPAVYKGVDIPRDTGRATNGCAEK